MISLVSQKKIKTLQSTNTLADFQPQLCNVNNFNNKRLLSYNLLYMTHYSSCIINVFQKILLDNHCV